MAEERDAGDLRTVWWQALTDGEAVCMIDQSRLPGEVVTLSLTDEQQVADAITTLKVRGAPAIGVTAAFGVALAAHRFWRSRQDFERSGVSSEAIHYLRDVGALLRATRPTAVNLSWAIERMMRCAERACQERLTCEELARRLLVEAQAIADEDYEACQRMGAYGADLIADGDILLTHCNAGALATAGLGTALAAMYVAHKAGKRLHVFVDETRPVLQGARLTAWELQQEGIPLTLITDSMAAHFMHQGEIKAVFVGADRIAANGDVANKIGTYGVAVLAHAHSIPFYVAAPCSTIDLSFATG